MTESVTDESMALCGGNINTVVKDGKVYVDTEQIANATQNALGVFLMLSSMVGAFNIAELAHFMIQWGDSLNALSALKLREEAEKSL